MKAPMWALGVCNLNIKGADTDMSAVQHFTGLGHIIRA